MPAGARQFASDVAGLAGLFAPYSRRAAVSAAAGAPADDSAAARPGRNRGRVGAGGQHFRELQVCGDAVVDLHETSAKQLLSYKRPMGNTLHVLQPQLIRKGRQGTQKGWAEWTSRPALMQ